MGRHTLSRFAPMGKAILLLLWWLWVGLGWVLILAWLIGCANPVPCPSSVTVYGENAKGRVREQGFDPCCGGSDGSKYTERRIGGAMTFDLGVDEHDCGFWTEQRREETE